METVWWTSNTNKTTTRESRQILQRLANSLPINWAPKTKKLILEIWHNVLKRTRWAPILWDKINSSNSKHKSSTSIKGKWHKSNGRSYSSPNDNQINMDSRVVKIIDRYLSKRQIYTILRSRLVVMRVVWLSQIPTTHQVCRWVNKIAREGRSLSTLSRHHLSNRWCERDRRFLEINYSLSSLVRKKWWTHRQAVLMRKLETIKS